MIILGSTKINWFKKMKLSIVVWTLSLGSTASIVRDSRQLQSIVKVGGNVLPRQTVERVEGIDSIQEFLEFAPAWDGAPEDRPVIVCLHGNLLKVRSRWQAVATLETLPRLFADPDTDTDPSVPLQHQPSQQDARARGAFRKVAAQFGWRACVVSPVMSKAGPWVPADVVAFVRQVAHQRLGASKRVYLVGTSVGAFSALRVLQHLAAIDHPSSCSDGGSGSDCRSSSSSGDSRSATGTTSSSSSSSTTDHPSSITWASAKDNTLLSSSSSKSHGEQLFAAVALVSPGCGLMAGPLFLEDPYCVMPHKIVDSFTLSVLATSIVKLGVPLMIYHGKRDEVVPLNNTLQLLAHVNRVSESAQGGGGGRQRGWCALRLVPNGRHDSAMWAAAYALDMSLYIWLLQHDLPVSHAHERSSSTSSTSSSSSSRSSSSSGLGSLSSGANSSSIEGRYEEGLSGNLPPGVQLLRMPAARLSTHHARARPGPTRSANTEGSPNSQQRNGAAGAGAGGVRAVDRFQDKRVARPAACGSGDPSVVFPCMPQGHTDPWERRQIAHPFAENRHPLLPLPPGYGSPAGGGGSGGSSGGIDKRRARSNKRGGHGGRLDMRSN